MVYDCLVASAEILFNDSGAVLVREPVDAAFSDARLEEMLNERGLYKT
jgi:hypothetical protein